MAILPILKAVVRPVLDYALPPRCPACGVIVETAGTICSTCWSSIEFLGEPLCAVCGMALPPSAGADATCAACLTTPPPFGRVRAVANYGEVPRRIAHRLKYGRRLGLSRVMAGHMVRWIGDGDIGEESPLLVPVPLHRWRIWSRGFNQSALIASEIARRTGLPVESNLLRRVRSTPPLHALRRKERERVVRGAFALAPAAHARFRGRHVILVDDIWTTGATASACARSLQAAGVARVDVLCWARVGAGEH